VGYTGSIVSSPTCAFSRWHCGPWRRRGLSRAIGSAGSKAGNDGNEPSGALNKRSPARRAGASAAGSGGRVLTTSDVVAIRIVDHPELDTTARIEPDGTINFPYVGRIQAAGRTEDDLGRAVGKRLVELKILAGP
jgi:hypothetical protein